MQTRFNGGVYEHIIAPFARVNGGAEEFVFLRPTSLPLVSFRGSGRLAGQFQPFQLGPSISLHATGAPQGLPFVNGDMYMQEAQEQNNNGGVDPIGPEQPL